MRVLAIVGVVLVALTAGSVSAAAETPPAAPGIALASLPASITQTLLDHSPDAYVEGSPAENALVAAACNGGDPIAVPRWFALPATSGPVYGNQSASFVADYTGQVTSVPVAAAVADTRTGAILQCGLDRPFAAAAGRPVSFVSFFPVDPRPATCVGCPQEDTVRQIFVGPTSGVAPANDRAGTAASIPALPFAATVDTTLADEDPIGLQYQGNCDRAGVHQDNDAWFTYAATRNGPPPDIQLSVPPGWPVTPAYRVYEKGIDGQIRPVTVTGGACVWLNAQAGHRYYIQVYSRWQGPAAPLSGGAPVTVRVSPPAPPAAPALRVTLLDHTSGNIGVAWTPPADTGGSPITGYRLSRTGRDVKGNGPTSLTVPATTAGYVFRNLSVYDPYTVSVQAISVVGTGPAASATVQILPKEPSIPLSVGVSALPPGGRQIGLSWTRPAHDGQTPIGSYRIARYAGSTAATPVTTTIPGDQTSFTATGLSPTTRYYFTVTAANRQGLSPVSQLVGPVTPVDGPGGPATDLASIPTGVVGSASATTATGTGSLTWAAPADTAGRPVTGYRVERDGTDTGGTGQWSSTLPATATAVDFRYLRPGTTYRLSVAAVTSAGVGAAVIATVTVPLAFTPSLVPGVSAVLGPVGSRQVRVSWSAPASTGGAASIGYRIQTIAGLDPTPVATVSVPGTQTSYTAVDLVDNRTYAFRVTAFNRNGSGPTALPTAPVSVIDPPGGPTWAGLPTAPSGVAATVRTAAGTGRSLVLSWNPPGDDGGAPVLGYRVERNGTDTGATGPYSITLPAAARSFSFDYLVGTPYTLTVAAVTATGVGRTAAITAG